MHCASASPVTDPPTHSYLEAIQFLEEPSISVRALVEAIAAAAQDARVLGLVMLFPAEGAGAGGSMDLAIVQEIRDSIEKFRNSGKITAGIHSQKVP